MYYQVYTFYDDLYINIITTNATYNNDCLICWDQPSKNNSVIKLQHFYGLTTTCMCNTIFHKKCLIKWFNHSHTCPICRQPIMINIQGTHINNNNNNNNNALITRNLLLYKWISKIVVFLLLVSYSILFTKIVYYIYNNILHD